MIKTRPDTWRDSRGQLGRGQKAKTARNSKKLGTDRSTKQPTRQGEELHVHDEKGGVVDIAFFVPER